MTATLWWLVQNSIAVAVLAAVIWVACRLLHTRPALQHALWLVVLIKFVTPPIVAWPWSASDIGDRIAIFVTPIENESASSPSDLSSSDHRSRFNDGSPVAAVPAVSNRTAELVEPTTESMAASPPALVSETAIRFALWLFSGLWLAGCVIALAVEVRRIARHEAVVRLGRPAPQPLVHEIAAVAGKLGLQPVPALVVPQIATPFVWCLGWLRLIWPEDLSSDTDLKRHRGIIAHELAHVKRRDHWVAWLELIAGCLWWWNPLFWYVRRQLRETADLACDAQALSLVPSLDRRAYAETFLELSYLASQRQTPAPALGVSTGARRTVERRLSMILNEHVKARISCLGLLLTALLALVALPAWSLGQAINAEQPIASEIDNLQGEWVVVAAEICGRRVASAEIKANAPRLTISGNQFRFRESPTETTTGSFKLETTRNSKRVEIEQADAMWLGIYELKQDTLRICFGSQSPAAFQTEPGSDAILVVCERITEQKHVERLEGTWTLTLAIVEGRKSRDEAVQREDTQWTFKDGKFTIRRADQPVQAAQAAFTVDPTAEPPTIDIIPADGPDAGKTCRGIYQLESDTLTLCVADPGFSRPTDFAAKAGSGHILSVFRRTAAEDTEKDGQTSAPRGIRTRVQPGATEGVDGIHIDEESFDIHRGPDGRPGQPVEKEPNRRGTTGQSSNVEPGSDGAGFDEGHRLNDTAARQGEGKNVPADSAGGAARAAVPVVGPVGLQRRILIPQEPSGLKRHILIPPDPSGLKQHTLPPQEPNAAWNGIILTPQEPSGPEKPAKKAEGDARFIRGLYLDLLGVPPSAQDVRRFVEDEKPSHVKRVAEIDRVLSDPRYVDKVAEQWLQKVKEPQIDQLESELHGLLERQHALLADLKNQRATEIEREGTENAMRAVRRMSLDLLGLPLTDSAAIDVREIVRETARRLLEKEMIDSENPIDSAIRARLQSLRPQE